MRTEIKIIGIGIVGCLLILGIYGFHSNWFENIDNPLPPVTIQPVMVTNHVALAPSAELVRPVDRTEEALNKLGYSRTNSIKISVRSN